jgi:hypothetical protein
VSLDRVPTLAQAAANSYLWPTDPVSSADETLYYNYLSEGEENHFHAREPEQRSRDRKGKGKARDDRERTVYGIYRTPDMVPRSYTTVNGMTTTIINSNRNAIIPGATPNQRVVPMRKTAFENIITPSTYMTPPDLRDQRPVDLDPSQYVDPYTLTSEFVSGYPDGYVAGYQAAFKPSNGELNHPTSFSTWGAEGPPPAPHNRSSRKPQPLSRWMTEGNLGGYPADSYRPAPPISAPPRTESRNVQDAVEEHTPRSPFSAPVSTTTASRPGVVEAPRPVWEERSRSASQQFQPTASAASSSASAQRLDVMHESVRPRSHRRRTVQIDGNVTEPEIQTSGQSGSHLRRRSAMSARRVDASYANGTLPVVDDRASPSLDATNTRNSISSWGTVDSENPPISVSDLPVHTDFSRGARGSMHSLSSLNQYTPSLNGMSGRVNEEETVERTFGAATPRTRATSSESVSTVRPRSTSSHATERPRDRRVASNPSIQPLPTENSRYVPTFSPLQGQTTEAALSFRNNATDSIFGRLSVDGSSENVGNSVEATLWTDENRVVDDPLSLAGNALGLHLARSDNVLGLQLNRSPQISAPTPMVPSGAFLRSFSDSYY